MAEETNTYQRTETVPPQYLAQFYQGVPGAGIPGIMPLLNQALVNQIMGLGVPGANPYTYTGARIAPFTPAQQEAFRMTAAGMGSYLPYYQRGEQMIEGGLGTATDSYGDARNLINQAVQSGRMSTEEAMGLLRQAPGIASAAAQEALGVGYGTMGMFDPSSVSDYYNPYEDQVVAQTMEDVRKGLAQGDIARRAGEVGAGAFGGSRGRLQGQELAEAAARGAAQQVGAIRAGGYQNAAQQAQAAFENQQARQAAQANRIGALGTNLAGLYGTTAGGLGSLGGNLANIYGGAGRDIFGSGSQLGQMYQGAGGQMANYGQGISGLYGTDINRMMGMGSAQQGMDQRALDLAYQNYVGQYNLPLQTIGQYGQLATGMAPAMGGTQLVNQAAGNTTNPLMQGLGMGLTAYGMLNPRGAIS